MNKPFGTYAPGSATIPLSLVTRMGLAHGGVVKKLRSKWISKHGCIVDAEVRGIRYRLDLSDNTTDTKILISSKIYDRPEIEVIASACKDKVFVDVGANIGYTRSLPSRMEPREPSALSRIPPLSRDWSATSS